MSLEQTSEHLIRGLPIHQLKYTENREGIRTKTNTASRALALTDNGARIINSGANVNINVPASSGVPWPTDYTATYHNKAATNSTITITTDVLNYVNVGAVTTVTVPQHNMVTLMWDGNGQWTLSGTAGVTAV